MTFLPTAAAAASPDALTSILQDCGLQAQCMGNQLHTYMLCSTAVGRSRRRHQWPYIDLRLRCGMHSADIATALQGVHSQQVTAAVIVMLSCAKVRHMYDCCDHSCRCICPNQSLVIRDSDASRLAVSWTNNMQVATASRCLDCSILVASQLHGPQ